MISVDKLQFDAANILFQDSLASRKSGAISEQDKSSALYGMDLSSGILSVDKTQKILQNELVGKLEKRFKQEGIELKGLNSDDFTPDKVAGRILSFIEMGIARAGDDEEKQSLLEQAREGVEQGFKEAKDILEAIGVLNGKVKEDIDKTYDLIQAGFDKLGKPVVDENDPEDDDKIKLIDETGYLGSSAKTDESRQTSVEIFTRDGDKVTINLIRQQSESSSQFYAKDGNQSIYAQSYSSSSYNSIEYQVEGDLDEGEQSAIADLLKQLNGVAKDFYQGDIESAFSKAKQVGFDSDELAKFSVDMSHQQSNQVAMSSYQNVQQDSNDKDVDSAQPLSFIKEVTDFMNQMDQVLKHNAFELFADADKSMADILTASLALQDKKQGQEQDETSQTPAYQSLNEMIESLHGLDKDSVV